MKVGAVSLPQDRDTYLQRLISRPFALRYASVRSSDSKESGQNGQDFVAFHIDEKHVTFCVCDGVSQSFYGELASRHLGSNLLEWLKGRMPYTLEAKPLADALTEYLDDLSRIASHEIKRQEIPKNVSWLLAEVLEEKRSRGSETTFACGIVEMPNQWFPRGRVVLAWIGDCRVRVGQGSGWGIAVAEDPDCNKGKWNTKRGIVAGGLRVWTSEAVKDDGCAVRRVLSYTDGLALLDKVEDIPSDERLSRLILEAVDSEYSDDCSLLEIEIVGSGNTGLLC